MAVFIRWKIELFLSICTCAHMYMIKTPNRLQLQSSILGDIHLHLLKQEILLSLLVYRGWVICIKMCVSQHTSTLIA